MRRASISICHVHRTYSVVQQQYVIVIVTVTYMERLRKGKRLVLRVVFLLAQPAGLAEEHHRVKHVAAVHAGGAFVDLVGVESEKPPLRVHRASHALESALGGRESKDMEGTHAQRKTTQRKTKETGGRCCFVVVTLLAIINSALPLSSPWSRNNIAPGTWYWYTLPGTLSNASRCIISVS